MYRRTKAYGRGESGVISGWKLRLVLLGGLGLVMLAGGCAPPSLLITPVSGRQTLEEVVVDRGQTRRAKIAMIEVEGLLTNERMGGGLLGGAAENKVSMFKQQLDAAAADGRVKAVVLRINSPGGTVPASDAMYELVHDFRSRTGKPVVAAIQTVGASGAYYIACAADEIHATPTSVVGSIGVMLQTLDVTVLLEKVGVRSNVIKSGPLKDLASPFHPMREEERLVMQQLVDEFYARFIAIVTAARPLNDPAITFDGRVFTGVQAREIGLVDRLVQLPETLAYTRQLVGEPDANVIMYKRPFGYTGSIYAHIDFPQPQAEQPEMTLRLDIPGLSDLAGRLRPGFYYLWMPG